MLLLTLLPVLTTASVVFNAVNVTPENAEELGFEVILGPTKPRTRVRITYPAVIDIVWIADYANISFRKRSFGASFLSRADFGPKRDKPIVFQIDHQQGQYDSTVLIFYKCQPIGDDRCNGSESRMYFFYSVLSHLRSNSR